MSKAWVLKNVGEIVFSDVEIPMPKEDEVRVRVKAAGICGSDIPRIYETGAHNMPLIPGHEFSGVVESIGKKVSPSWLGKRVAVFPKIACGKCRECQDELPDMCQNYDYIGSRRDGAFAEYVTVPAFLATTQTPESTAALASIPVPTTGASVKRRGTA